MRRLYLSVTAVILIAPLLVLAGASRSLIARSLAYVTTDSHVLAPVLADAASRFLGRRVRIGSALLRGRLLDLRSTNTLLLQDVSVAGASAGSGSVASAARVVVRYSGLSALLSTGPGASVIDQALLVHPMLHLSRDSGGHWNIASLIKPPQPGARPLLRKLVIQAGAVSYGDQRFPHGRGIPPRPLTTRVSGLNGVILFRSDRTVVFSGSGDAISGLARAFRVSGTVQPAPLSVSVDLVASSADLRQVSARLLPSNGAQVTSGRADFDITTDYAVAAPGAAGTGASWDVGGRFRLSQATVSGGQIGSPLTALSGTGTFNRHSVTASLAGTYAGSGLTVTGSVFFPQGGGPVIAAHGSVARVDLERLARIVTVRRFLAQLSPPARQQLARISGTGSGDFRIIGDLNHPAAGVTAQLASLHYGSYTVAGPTVSAALAGRDLTVSARARYAGGTVTLGGDVDTRTGGRYVIQAHGRGIHLARAGLRSAQPISGLGEADVILRGNLPHAPVVDAQVQVTNGRVRHVSMRSLYASLHERNGKVLVGDLRAVDPTGAVRATGLIDLNSHMLDLDYRAQGLDLAAIYDELRSSRQPDWAATTRKYPWLPQTGVAFVRGTVQRTWDDPMLQGSADILGPEAAAGGSLRLTGDFDWSRRSLAVRGGVLRRYGGAIRFAGTIDRPFERGAKADVTARAEAVDLSDLLHLAGRDPKLVPVEGDMYTDDAHLKGPVDAVALVAPVRVRLQNGYVNDLPIDSANAQVTYRQGEFAIQDAIVQTAGGRFVMRGTVGTDKRVNLVSTVEGLKLSGLADALLEPSVAAVDGRLDLDASVSGTLEQPIVDVSRVRAQNLAYNQFKIGDLTGSLRYSGPSLTARNLLLAAPEGAGGPTITVPEVSYDTDTHRISMPAAMPLRVAALTVSRMRDLMLNTPLGATPAGASVANSLASVSGAVDASVVLSGTASKPAADVQLVSADIRVANTVLKSVAGNARVTDSAAEVRNLHIEAAAVPGQPTGAVVDGHAVIAFDGPVSGDIDAYNVDLGMLQDLVSEGQAQKYRVLGSAAYIGLAASGTTRSPVLDVSVSLRNPGLENLSGGPSVRLDSADIAHALIREGSIRADQIELSKVGASLSGQPGATTRYTASAHGSLGFSWSRPFIDSAAALSFDVDVPRQDLGLLTAFGAPHLTGSAGTVTAHLNVSGTRASPSFNGALTLDAPTMRFTGMTTGLQNFGGAVSFNGDQLVVHASAMPHVFAPAGAGLNATEHVISLDGSLPLGLASAGPATAGLHLSADRVNFDEARLPVAKSGSARGAAAVDVRISGSLRRPDVTGDVSVTDGRVTLPSDLVTGATETVPLPIVPTFNMHLNIGNNVRMTSSGLDARAIGRIDLTGTWSRTSSPRVNGILTIVQGTLRVPTARFTIVPPGSVSFVYPLEEASLNGQSTLGITVDVRAQTYLTAASVSGGSKRYRVIVTARGPMVGNATNPLTGEPRLALSFTTDPPDIAMSDAGIAQQLAGAGALSQLAHNPTEALASEIADVFTGSVLPQLFERPAEALGFEELSLGYDPIQRLTINLSRHLFGPLYVRYTRTLNAIQETYDLKFGVRFSRKFQLSYDTNELNEQRLLLEGVFSY